MTFQFFGGAVAALIVLTANTVAPRAEVRIASEMRIPFMAEYVEVKAGRYHSVQLNLKQGDSVEVGVRVHNRVYKDLSTFICSEREMANFANGQSFRCVGTQKALDPIQVNFTAPQAGKYFVLLNNSYSRIIKKKANFNIVITTHLDENAAKELTTQFGGMHREIMETFDVQDFGIRMEPCGQSNAFSTNQGGHITICSELFVELAQKNLPGALEGIFYHELGHTLLNLWGMPGWDNEETVDEFAIVMMYWNGRQEQTMDWIKYFAKNDPKVEANYKIKADDRHPLSIQRVRNAERILHNPREVVERWNRFLYPHLTKAQLRKIMDNPPKYGDRQMAQSILSSR